jgi:hypothetical protein
LALPVSSRSAQLSRARINAMSFCGVAMPRFDFFWNACSA